MELRTKKIIAREGLIFLAWIVTIVLAVGMCFLVFTKCFIPIVLILKNPFDVGIRILKSTHPAREWLSLLFYMVILLWYPAYLLIYRGATKFIIWAVRILRAKEWKKTTLANLLLLLF